MFHFTFLRCIRYHLSPVLPTPIARIEQTAHFTRHLRYLEGISEYHKRREILNFLHRHGLQCPVKKTFVFSWCGGGERDRTPHDKAAGDKSNMVSTRQNGTASKRHSDETAREKIARDETAQRQYGTDRKKHGKKQQNVEIARRRNNMHKVVEDAYDLFVTVIFCFFYE